MAKGIFHDVAHRIAKPGDPLGHLPKKGQERVFVRAMYTLVPATIVAQVPANGQLLYDPAAGRLRVSKVAENGAALEQQLLLLKPGDTIKIRTQLYTIGTVTPAASYVEFLVTPLAVPQAAGVLPIEFKG